MAVKLQRDRLADSLREEGGRLYFDSHSVSDLAKKFGTPLYVYSEDRIRENYRRMHSVFSQHYKDFAIYYAIKSNNDIAILKILKEEGASADCSSPAEIFFAQQAGFSKNKMVYTGNYNSDEEFVYAIENDVVLNLDDISHIKRVERIKKQDSISLRINPGIGKGGFVQLVFAGEDAKFGVPQDQAVQAYSQLKESGVKKFGIHMMTGSNVLESTYFKLITEKLMDIAGNVSKEVGIKFSYVNIGGGFGIPYGNAERALDIGVVARDVTTTFIEKCKEYSMGSPQLRVEPGRYLVGDAGILLARVTSIKRTEKTNFIGCDAGMNTLLRPALYDAYQHIFVDGKVDRKNKPDQHKGPVAKFNVCGQICENTDQFAKGRELPKGVEEKDILAILDAGAYGFGMGSQYNSRPRAAEVLTTKNSAELIRERETSSDLLNKQKIPDHLK